MWTPLPKKNTQQKESELVRFRNSHWLSVWEKRSDSFSIVFPIIVFFYSFPNGKTVWKNYGKTVWKNGKANGLKAISKRPPDCHSKQVILSSGGWGPHLRLQDQAFCSHVEKLWKNFWKTIKKRSRGSRWAYKGLGFAGSGAAQIPTLPGPPSLGHQAGRKCNEKLFKNGLEKRWKNYGKTVLEKLCLEKL